jgi:type IV pilus assembly protein PilV
MGTSLGFIRNKGMTAAAGCRRQAGVMLIEVLIAILIFSIGILAVVGMQAAAINNVTDAKYRSEAAFLTNRLVSQLWTDVPNISTTTYDYPGTGTPPASLTNWINDVYARLPNASTVPPIVKITNLNPGAGAQVTITVQWRMNEEAAQSPLPAPHNYTVVASIYTS